MFSAKQKGTKMLTYAVVETLNGNYILKPIDKVKETDNIEIELYGESLPDIKQQFKEHKKELR